MFERIVYVSRAAPGVGARQAYDIIRASHNRNSAAGLTGALLLADGWFAQVLEGDAFALAERYAAIRADPRHEALDLREQRPIRERAFPGEWMALRHGDALSDALRREFGYVPGLPREGFDGERVVALLRACVGAAALSAG